MVRDYDVDGAARSIRGKRQAHRGPLVPPDVQWVPDGQAARDRSGQHPAAECVPSLLNLAARSPIAFLPSRTVIDATIPWRPMPSTTSYPQDFTRSEIGDVSRPVHLFEGELGMLVQVMARCRDGLHPGLEFLDECVIAVPPPAGGSWAR